MPVVHRPEQEPVKKQCEIIPPYFEDGSHYYNNGYRRYESREPVGTIWQCPECGKYTVSVKRGTVRVWIPVYWYRFGARKIIRDLEQPGVDTGSTVL